MRSLLTVTCRQFADAPGPLEGTAVSDPEAKRERGLVCSEPVSSTCPGWRRPSLPISPGAASSFSGHGSFIIHVAAPAVVMLIPRYTGTDLTFEELVTVGRRDAGVTQAAPRQPADWNSL